MPRANLTLLQASNKGADQHAHPHSPTSPFVIPSLESMVVEVAIRRISTFYLFFVAEQVGYTEDRFSSFMAQIYLAGHSACTGLMDCKESFNLT